eukprot:1156521-Pelagomonas_calceolata.AAC.3
MQTEGTQTLPALLLPEVRGAIEPLQPPPPLGKKTCLHAAPGGYCSGTFWGGIVLWGGHWSRRWLHFGSLVRRGPVGCAAGCGRRMLCWHGQLAGRQGWARRIDAVGAAGSEVASGTHIAVAAAAAPKPVAALLALAALPPLVPLLAVAGGAAVSLCPPPAAAAAAAAPTADLQIGPGGQTSAACVPA